MSNQERYTYLIDVAQKGEMSGRPYLSASTEADARAWLRDHARLAGDGPVWRDQHGSTYTIRAVPRIIPST